MGNLRSTSCIPAAADETMQAQSVQLRNVFFHVTKACNLRCGYCYFSAAQPLPDELCRAELHQVWVDLVALKPEKVVLTGGEPLLRADIVDLLRDFRAADPGYAVAHCLNTNGHFVTPELARELVGLVDEVRVSIDALAARNDMLRGAGNFAAALHAFEMLHAAGFEPKALVTVTAESLPDLDELVRYLLATGIRRINLNTFRPIGRGKAHPSWRPDPTAARNVVARVRDDHAARAGLRTAASPVEIVPETPRNCGVGQFLNIMPNGDVFPCHVLTQAEFCCGNLRRESLQTICRRNGLLGTLAALDFHDLSARDERLAPLRQPSVCMGQVYPCTKTSPVWKDKLSGIKHPGPGISSDQEQP
jgi:MoaA/NifB/PqqE/SkfB family radical SAM enzyme